MPEPLYLSKLGLVSPLGQDLDCVYRRLTEGEPGLVQSAPLLGKPPVPVGAVLGPLAPWPPQTEPRYRSRNNQLLLQAYRQLEDWVQGRLQALGPERVGVVIGTSTSGVLETEGALKAKVAQGEWPLEYDYRTQEIGNGPEFLQQLCGAQGPAYGVSTACTSSAKALGSAVGLIRAGLCDGVLVGGVDSLCGLTLNGFATLAALSAEPARPFEADRQGLNIGEGAALFWLGREPAPVELLAVGESSDAHHMSAPDPTGQGAGAAMRAALAQAGLSPQQIDYLNLHGTATPLNDAMEAKAVAEVFGFGPKLSSTKPLTGHLLGAAGAMEAAVLWLVLTLGGIAPKLPAQTLVGPPDPRLAPLNFAQPEDRLAPGRDLFLMSNNFAFGGSNCSVILGRRAGWN